MRSSASSECRTPLEPAAAAPNCNC
jgi:hypothetical protein